MPSRRYTALVAALLTVTAGVTATTASAGVEQFMSNGQGLGHGNAKAGTVGAGFNLIVTAKADHTFCPAIARFYAGYTSTPFSNGHATHLGTNCGPGTHGESFGNTAWAYQGAVYNGNKSTFDTFEYASFRWDG
jgi:hypothetical protein